MHRFHQIDTLLFDVNRYGHRIPAVCTRDWLNERQHKLLPIQNRSLREISLLRSRSLGFHCLFLAALKMRARRFGELASQAAPDIAPQFAFPVVNSLNPGALATLLRGLP